MSDLCIWPPENKPGLGEIDLEVISLLIEYEMLYAYIG